MTLHEHLQLSIRTLALFLTALHCKRVWLILDWVNGDNRLEVCKGCTVLAAESRPLVATPRPAPLTPSPRPLTPLGQSPFETVETGQSGVPDSWEGVCDWVLGKRLDLWQELFETPFLKVLFFSGFNNNTHM